MLSESHQLHNVIIYKVHHVKLHPDNVQVSQEKTPLQTIGNAIHPVIEKSATRISLQVAAADFL